MYNSPLRGCAVYLSPAGEILLSLPCGEKRISIRADRRELEIQERVIMQEYALNHPLSFFKCSSKCFHIEKLLSPEERYNLISPLRGEKLRNFHKYSHSDIWFYFTVN